MKRALLLSLTVLLFIPASSQAEPYCELVTTRTYTQCGYNECAYPKRWREVWRRYEREPDSEDCVDEDILINAAFNCDCTQDG